MREKYLDNKKVLFMSWAFYEYPEKIKEKLEEQGAIVDYYCTSPTKSFIKMKMIKKLRYINEKYFKDLFDKIKNKKYDYIFIINAASFPEFFLEDVANNFKDIKKILYCWDSISTFAQVENYFKYFDKVYSFDSNDTLNNNNLEFLPLFYCDDLYSNKNINYRYDFSFIGFGHTKRYNFIKQIKKYADNNSLSYYFNLYLPSYFHYIVGKYIKKNFRDAKKSDFIFRSVSQEVIKDITNNSKIVIDLELSNQSGLTMRTIESLGMRKKLITTNKNIIEYDFYNENNILIVDKDNPIIPKEFILNKYSELPQEIYYKYTLTNWLYMIFRNA